MSERPSQVLCRCLGCSRSHAPMVGRTRSAKAGNGGRWGTGEGRKCWQATCHMKSARWASGGRGHRPVRARGVACAPATGCYGMSLRTRILLLVLLAVMLPAAVFVHYLVGHRQDRAAEARRNLASLAGAAAAGLDARIRATSQMLYGLARASSLDTQDRCSPCSSRRCSKPRSLRCGTAVACNAAAVAAAYRRGLPVMNPSSVFSSHRRRRSFR